jgi:hypothetical protein
MNLVYLFDPEDGVSVVRRNAGCCQSPGRNMAYNLTLIEYVLFDQFTVTIDVSLSVTPPLTICLYRICVFAACLEKSLRHVTSTVSRYLLT